MSVKEAEVARACGFDPPYAPDETYPPPAEIFPKRPAYVAREENGERVLDKMLWGFPHTITGASGKRIEKQVTNVRNYASPFWRSALKNPERRCLVPFTSFSEYGPGEKGNLPLYWFDVPSRPIACFAGVWRPAEGGPVFAFLTTEPNSVVAPIHPKAMPVILHDEDYDRWLRAPLEEALTLAAPFPAQLMAVAPPEYPTRKPVA
jgi:putative SOS response-associated peptidase YedK